MVPISKTLGVALGLSPMFLSELGPCLALTVALSPVVSLLSLPCPWLPILNGIWLSVPVALTLTLEASFLGPCLQSSVFCLHPDYISLPCLLVMAHLS